jgi:hypothetical protein
VKKRTRKEYKPPSSVSRVEPTVTAESSTMMNRNRFAPLCGDDEDVDEANEEPFDVALVGAADGVVADTN